MTDLIGIRGLVLDASILINLLATQECRAIVEAVNVHCVAAEQAINEVIKHPVTAQIFSGTAEKLHQLRPVEMHHLDAAGIARFVSLASAAPPDGLGDGEAASIAAAHRLGYGICLDDGKARRIVSEAYPELPVWWSVELLGHKRVEKALGVKRAKDCIDSAKVFGRMRLPRDWAGR